jgi:anaerobic nitric oxide reductase flavorubredoxin
VSTVTNMDFGKMNSKLSDNIEWVGYVDWEIRDFHSYETAAGATYNAYLIRDDKTALIDTVKLQHAGVLLSKLAGTKVDYIVINHAEPDHAGSISKVVAAHPGAVIVCNQKTKNILSAYHNTKGWAFQIVKTGDSLSLGKHTIQFVETPMAHWPDSMCSYVPECKILFSMDAFGQHYASQERFDDEIDDITEVFFEAKKYYANILMPFPRPIAKALEAVSQLDIAMIAPAHGIIWRKYIPEIISMYSVANTDKVLVIYDSMWGSTKMMAHEIARGANAKVMSVRASSLTEIATEVLDAKAIAFGSATLNMGMMPMMGAVLTYLKGLKPMNKTGFAFGSYGWGKGAPEAIDEYLQSMKFAITQPPLKSQWKPSSEVLQECYNAGKKLI